MDFSGDLSLGPFTIPIRFVVIAACLAGAVLAARIPLRRHQRLRAMVTERLVNTVVIFAAAWKLAPAVLNPLELFRDPLPLLMGAPGISGLILGIVGAAVYAALALVRPRRLRQAAVVPLILFAMITAAGLGVELIGARPAGPGPAAPALTLRSLDGQSVSLESFRGRVVIVNFWATWCPPCRAEIPALVEFTRQQGRTGAVLLPVNAAYSESSPEAVRAFVKKYRLDTDVLLDQAGEAARTWDVRAYPSTFVVDVKGRVSARRTGAVDSAWLRRQAAAAARR